MHLMVVGGCWHKLSLKAKKSLKHRDARSFLAWLEDVLLVGCVQVS